MHKQLAILVPFKVELAREAFIANLAIKLLLYKCLVILVVAKVRQRYNFILNLPNNLALTNC